MAVSATGARQVAGLAEAEAHDRWPCRNPFKNAWLAAMVASTALAGTPGAMASPPAWPSRPPWYVLMYGGLEAIRSTMLPGSRSLNTPNPARTTVRGANCQATAVRGCHITSGVDEKTPFKPVASAWFRG